MVSAVEACFGKIDILVNNAYIADTAPAEVLDDEIWRKVLAFNLDSVFYIAREVGNVMLKNGC